MRVLHRMAKEIIMKLENYCIDTQNRLRSVLSENGKKNGFKKGNNHPNWKGGIKKNADGYIKVLIESTNPYFKMSVCGYVKRSRLIMAESLKRCLESTEIVHHCNGVRDDDDIDNLMLLKDHSNHATLHHKLRKRAKIETIGT